MVESMMPKSARGPAVVDREVAETIALQGLAFLASEPVRMAHFLNLTGLEPADVRERAGTGELAHAVLEHLGGDESLLLVFASTVGLAPETVSRAVTLLQDARA
jgi:hypothetical protein